MARQGGEDVLFIAVYSPPTLYVTGIFKKYIFYKTATKPKLFRIGHIYDRTHERDLQSGQNPLKFMSK